MAVSFLQFIFVSTIILSLFLANLITLTSSSPASINRNFTNIKKVPKAYNGQVYVHIMPWFETRETNINGAWGIHWTMSNQNPDIIVDGTGKRQIAAHYYPEIGPYGSGDDSVIDYQLMLMKFSGVDGILIDWPGTINAWDYPKNLENTNALIRGTERVGLNFAIVYEDHNVGMAFDAGFITNKIQAAQADMNYLRSNYFTKSNYIRVNNAPLLLDFGPQTFKSPSDWTSIFSVFNSNEKPTFLTLWYQSQEAEGSSSGEYCWIYTDYLDGLRNFYQNRPLNVKMGGAYPGFHTFYAQGGWPGPTWSLPYGDTFDQALALAIDNGLSTIQLNTWNDYGEGTMIEPTREFGNSFLTTLQNRIGVAYTENELKLVKALYDKRKKNTEDQIKLNQVFDALVELDVVKAQDLLSKI